MSGRGRPAKLSPLEKSQVYNMAKNNVPHAEIAYKHGVSVSTIARIVKEFKANEKADLGGDE